MVYISPIAQYIVGVDVLQGLAIQTMQGEFHLQVWVVKTVVWGHPHHKPVVLPSPTRTVRVHQYRFPGGHEEISQTILKLEAAGIIRPTHSLFNSHVASPEARWYLVHDS